MRLLRRAEVLEKVGLSAPEIFYRIKRGEFPKQIPLGPARVGWLESEVDAWIAARVADRDAGAVCSKRIRRKAVAR